MYSFFGDPRDARHARRRQDRQDFFPSFSNSLFFDPFSQQDRRQASQGDYEMDDPELYPDYRLKPQHHRSHNHQQQHLRQQEEQRRRAFWEQQQRQNDDEDEEEEDEEEEEEEEDEEESERLRQIAKQQQEHQLLQQQQQLQQQQKQQQLQQQRRAAAQRKAQQQQQQHHHTTKDTSPPKQSHRPTSTHLRQQHQQPKPPGRSAEGSSKRNRRQRRRDRQNPRSDGEAIATSARQESVDDMQSLVEAAFGEKTMLSDSPGQAPKPKVGTVSEHEGDSDEASDHIGNDIDNSATEVYSADEEESIQPDPEQQQKSLVQLHEIERDLQELSQELQKMLSGEISNKKHILLIEENLTKAMLRIDAVESGGDDSVRRQRKGLIDKAERLLEKVDEYKHRTKTSAFSRSH